MGNWFNNASFRRVSVNASYGMVLEDNTQATIPAIFAWVNYGNGVGGPPDNTVAIATVDVPGEGRFFVGGKAIDNGDGSWRYEYAVYNLFSHRAAGSFSVPLTSTMNVSGVGFHAPLYHSGEQQDNTPWTSIVGFDSIQWNTAHTYLQNPKANAIRWGTMYNFWFTANRPPVTGQATLGLFRPGTPSEVGFQIIIPQPMVCHGDVAPPGGDGVVNVNDLLAVINAWGPCPTPPAYCPDPAPPGGDGFVNVNDLLAVINAWGTCP
jgi:hypothetical protein